MLLLLIPLLGGLIGDAASQRRGFSPVAGVLGGLLLGPFAVFMFFVSGVTRGDASRKCPACAEWIKAEAVVCKHCGSAVALAQATTPTARTPRGRSSVTTLLTVLVAVLAIVVVVLVMVRLF